MEPSQPVSPFTNSLLSDENDTDLEEFDETATLEDVEDDFLNVLLKTEIDFTADRFKADRLEAIEDILYIRERLGFRGETSYLAVTYMDRFLSIAVINQGVQQREMELLPIACLSLAINMEESMKMKPLNMLALFPNIYKFPFQEVERVENLVLSTLEWRMNLVSPFPFVHHFVSRLCQNTTITVSNVIEVMLKAIKDEMTTKWRPSTIAAAATLFTLNKTLTKESLKQRIETLACRASLNIEDILTLYNRLKEHNSRDTNLPNTRPIPPWSPFQLPSGHPGESSTRSAASVGSKRTQGDRNMENGDNKRQK